MDNTTKPRVLVIKKGPNGGKASVQQVYKLFRATNAHIVIIYRSSIVRVVELRLLQVDQVFSLLNLMSTYNT